MTKRFIVKVLDFRIYVLGALLQKWHIGKDETLSFMQKAYKERAGHKMYLLRVGLEKPVIWMRGIKTRKCCVFDKYAGVPIQYKVIMALDNLYSVSIKKNVLEWNLTVGVPTGQNTVLTWDTSKVPQEVKLNLRFIILYAIFFAPITTRSFSI
ncbi:MAG: hypothetical protein ACE5KE_06855 [Methanosarcinales archaeon]